VHWTLSAGGAFAELSCFLQFAILLLGAIRLARPGAIVLLYLVWIGTQLSPRKLKFDYWRFYAVTSASMNLRAAFGYIQTSMARARQWPTMALWAVLLLAYLVHSAPAIVNNLRFPEMDGYARALSLAVLSEGEPWRMDPSVSYLLPLVWLSALPAPAIVRLSAALFGYLLVLAAGFLAFQYTHSRTAALLAGGFLICLNLWREAAGNGDSSIGLIPATFALLALALLRRRPKAAIVAAIAAASMSAGFGCWRPLLSGIAAAILAAAAARLARVLSVAWRRAVPAFATLLVVAAIGTRPLPVRPEGPYQYEAAARVCDRIGRTYARNTWAIVSPSQELPFTYGRGWHIELADFVRAFSPAEVADASFRFPYPVRDIFVFVERQPLWTGGGKDRAAYASIDVVSSGDRVMQSYFTRLGRVGLEFGAARLVAAYSVAHDDMAMIYIDDYLAVYHIKRVPPTD
jgi:hypothetical protein